jgi:GxxExxY protein
MNTDKTQTPQPPSADGVYPHRELTEKIIGAAFEVHRELGAGFLEKVYEAALLRELTARSVPAAQQAQIEVPYKGHTVGVYFADLLVDGRVICEIKAVAALSAEHEAQLLNYLRATGIKVGLLLNFGRPKLQIKRLVF